MNIHIDENVIFKKILLIILVLFFAHSFGVISQFYLGHGRLYGLIDLFNFAGEYNVPATYSYLALLACAFLLFIIGFKHKMQGVSYWYWFGLMFVFLFLATDEIVTIHERLNSPVSAIFGTSGIFYYGWVIPYCFFVLFFVIAYGKFLLRLPRNIAVIFITSGAMFVLGAVGFEMLGGIYAEKNGVDNMVYTIYYTIEEMLEMSGIATFIYGLLKYINQQFGGVPIVITKSKFS